MSPCAIIATSSHFSISSVNLPFTLSQKKKKEIHIKLFFANFLLAEYSSYFNIDTLGGTQSFL
jgi:hypothetical protein